MFLIHKLSQASLTHVVIGANGKQKAEKFHFDCNVNSISILCSREHHYIACTQVCDSWWCVRAWFFLYLIFEDQEILEKFAIFGGCGRGVPLRFIIIFY